MKSDYSIHLDSPGEMDLQSAWWSGYENLDLCRSIAAYITGPTVLDAGAGSGAAIPIWLTEEDVSRVIAVDISAEAIAALSRMPNVTVVACDLRELSTPADTVICKAVLKHFGPDWRAILQRLCACARATVIFTMNVAASDGDQNLDVPYSDWAVPADAIESAIPHAWQLTTIFGDPKEPVFVCHRKP